MTMLDAEIQYVLPGVVSPLEVPGIRMTCEVHAQTTPEFGRSPWEWMASPREFSVFESLLTSKRVYKPINQNGEVDDRYTLAEMNTIVSRYAPENTLLLVLRHIPDGCTR